MRVLLVKPYQPVAGHVTQPPLGILYLASSLRQRFGTEVEVDLIDLKSRELPPRWLADRLHEYQPDVVGLSALNCEAAAAREIARLCKLYDPKIVTVLGGPYAHRRSNEILGNSDFDWSFDGPADHVFPDALERHFGNNGDLGTDIPGLSYKTEDGIQLSERPDVITDLDAIPFPAYDLIDLDFYAPQPNMMGMLKGKKYAPLFTSRGCPYTCNYCHDLFGKKFVHRSPDSVLAEIDMLRGRYGVDEFQIVDDIFNLHKPRLKKIMGEVANRWPGQTHFTFPNALRADILDDSVLDALRAAGTYGICMAIETTTPRLQELVSKNLKLDKAFWSINAADKRGILVSGFFMLGFPTETREELQRTVDFAVESRLTMAHFFTVIPQPETPMYELARKESPEALAATDRDEEEGASYRTARAWYERAYGFPLADFVRKTNRRFYLNPKRIARIVKRVPAKSLATGLRQLMPLVFRRETQGATVD